MPLNAAQSRAVRAAFTHVSELLDGVLKLAREDLNPFDRQRPDLTRAEARRLAVTVSATRTRMLDALAALGVPPPQPEGSARWSARTAFLFSDIAFSEISGSGMRGYGPLDAESERLLSAVTQDLRGLVERAQVLLRGVDPAFVGGLVEAVTGAAAHPLRGIWSFALDHELVDVYQDVAAVAERAAAPAADVGVFGRTNAGKSSLINALVGRDVLPVGAVPVTAVPLRLARGPAALHLRRDGKADEELPLESLSAFTIESLGSEETDLLAMDAFVPTAPEGLRFIDTPGVGAYGAPVEARAFEWLPRCDLGLLLVPTGSELEDEDLALVRGLQAAGVDVVVVLSKADLVAPDDRREALRHTGHAFERLLARQPSHILEASVTGGAEGLDTLRETVLEPLVGERARDSQDRIVRRLRHLLSVVEAAYEGRASDSLVHATQRGTVVAGARKKVDGILDGLHRAGADALQAASDALAQAWAEGSPDPRASVEAALASTAEAALEALRHVLDDAGREAPGSALSGPPPMPPLFAPPPAEALPDLRPSFFAGRLLPGIRAARRLSALRVLLDEAYAQYAGRLRTWSSATLEALARGDAPDTPDSDTDVAAEIEELRRSVAALSDSANAPGRRAR